MRKRRKKVVEKSDGEDRIEAGGIVEALLDSRAIELVMSLEFVRKNKFKKKKLERSIYVRNVDDTFNHKEPIEHMVEVELFYRRHKERMEINVIGGQKWSIILGIS